MDLGDELYREVIMDHYQSPRFHGIFSDADVVSDGNNPLCGDAITLYLGIRDGVIHTVTWHGKGCSICLASTSMLCTLLKGKSLAQAHTLVRMVIHMMHGTPLPQELADEDIAALQGVRKFPVRIKCALLPWTTLEEGVKQHDRSRSQHYNALA